MFSNVLKPRQVRLCGSVSRGFTTRIQVKPSSSSSMHITHPMEPGVTVDTIKLSSVVEVTRILSDAQQTFTEWSALSFDNRMRRVRAAVDAVAVNAEIPEFLSASIGKPINQGVAELRGFRARAQEQMSIAPSCLGIRKIEGNPEPFFPQTISYNTIPSTGSIPQSNDKAMFDRGVGRFPAGVVLALTPWNYPFLTACQYLIPGLLAGNAVVISPSLTVARAMDKLVRIFHAHGVFGISMISTSPSNLWSGVAAAPPQVIGFVGSTNTGVEVVRSAASTAPLAQVLLELGGTDAVYISERNTPEQIKAAVDAMVEGITWNAGQSCCAPQRLFVQRSIEKQVKQYFQTALQAVQVVVPNSNIAYSVETQEMLANVNTGHTGEVTMSGLAMAKHGDDLRRIIAMEHKDDTFLGNVGAGTGAIFSPGVIWAHNEAALDYGLWQSEAFGPVIVAKTVESIDSALALANDCNHGLTSCIYTNSTEEMKKWTVQAEAGTVMVNRSDYVDPSGVWAGWKHSGRGEMGGFSSFFNLTRAKTVHVKRT